MVAHAEMDMEFAFLKEEEDRLRERLLAGQEAPPDFLQEVTPEMMVEMAHLRWLYTRERYTKMEPNILVAWHSTQAETDCWFHPPGDEQEPEEHVSSFNPWDGLDSSDESCPEDRIPQVHIDWSRLGGCSKFSKFFLEILPASVQQHLLLAGGAPTNDLLGMKFQQTKDWDLFLLDLQEPEVFVAELLRLWEPFIYYAIRTRHSLTLKMDHNYDKFTVQVILRVYRSAVEVLTGFDLDASTCGFQNGRYWVTPRCRYALERGLLHVDLDRMSTTYNRRLCKYLKTKAFDLALPVPVESRHFLATLHPQSYQIRDNERLLQCSLVGLIYQIQNFGARRKFANFGDSDYCPIELEDFLYETDTTVGTDVLRVFRGGREDIIGYGLNKHHLTPERLLGLDDFFCRYKVRFEGRFDLPDRVEFVTVNPGRQHTASFHPQEITLREWVDMSPFCVTPSP